MRSVVVTNSARLMEMSVPGFTSKSTGHWKGRDRREGVVTPRTGGKPKGMRPEDRTRDGKGRNMIENDRATDGQTKMKIKAKRTKEKEKMICKQTSTK